ncbi:MAG: nucleotidyltransferase domain-containing protein [Candidatus Electrothrix sp. AUS1_2]|nr:nucleotidyltransferase domain-containing protein [Candidatus Electrothrix sp. AUS1_2]
MNPHGLGNETVAKICAVFARHPAVERAVLYGSRGKGNFKPGSDIDLSLNGAGLSLQDLRVIHDELDELLLPYSIDVLIFDTLRHEKLKEHIERAGVVLYIQEDTTEHFSG